MKIKKRVTTQLDPDVNVRNITLLTLKEYKKYFENIVPIKQRDWWLQSPGTHSILVTCVNRYGDANKYGTFVGDPDLAVRPVLKIKSFRLPIGDKFTLFGHNWTMISKRLALCDDIIGYCAFREKDYEANDANDYIASDVRKFINNWFERQKGVINKNYGIC